MAVYPRWRGEHTGLHRARPAPAGLSPLARGTLCANLACSTHLRFIPAGAGNTCCVSLSVDQTPVYPRWRGEHCTARARLL